jgi:alanyl-tRNA synthetase
MAWTLDEVERQFLQFMEDRGHALIDGHSVLSPTDDVLFTTAGMHPLTPYLHGEAPPPGGDSATCSAACAPPTSTRWATPPT